MSLLAGESSGRRPARRMAGQAMAEFSLVVIVFMAVVIFFFVLAGYKINQNSLDQSVALAARDGNLALASINRFVTSPSQTSAMLLTPYPCARRDCGPFGPYMRSNSVTGCLKVRNQYQPSRSSPVYNRNSDVLGWDWSCGAFSNSLLYGPLDTAIRSAGTVHWVGPQVSVVVTACYADSDGDCVLSRRYSNGSYSTIWSGARSDHLSDPAPSFIKVEALVRTYAVSNVLFNLPPQVLMWSSSLEPLDRFLPACPAPAFESQVRAGSCGAIY